MSDIAGMTVAELLDLAARKADDLARLTAKVEALPDTSASEELTAAAWLHADIARELTRRVVRAAEPLHDPPVEGGV
jgi:hypothetical protein